MKINRNEGINIINAYISKTKSDQINKTEKDPVRQASSLSVSPDQEVDKVDISLKAKELQLYKAKLAQVPEVREEVVAILKKAIQDGTFQVDSGKIAEGLAEEIRLDERV